MTEKRIHWNGNFSNEAKTGTVVSQAGDLLTIKWDDGRQQVVPEIVTNGFGWSRK